MRSRRQVGRRRTPDVRRWLLVRGWTGIAREVFRSVTWRPDQSKHENIHVATDGLFQRRQPLLRLPNSPGFEDKTREPHFIRSICGGESARIGRQGLLHIGTQHRRNRATSSPGHGRLRSSDGSIRGTWCAKEQDAHLQTKSASVSAGLGYLYY